MKVCARMYLPDYLRTYTSIGLSDYKYMHTHTQTQHKHKPRLRNLFQSHFALRWDELGRGPEYIHPAGHMRPLGYEARHCRVVDTKAQIR